MEYIAVSSVLPSLLLLYYFHRRDVFPEPPKVLWTTFGLGVLTVVPVLAVAAPISPFVNSVGDPALRGLLTAFLLAAVPEEFFKYLVLVLYALRHREFDEPMDGIVYGAAASLGFATLENIMYVAEGGMGVAVMRALTAVPNHAFLGAVMGYFVGQAKFAPAGRRAGFMLWGYVIPMLMHGIYDFPLMAVSNLSKAGSVGLMGLTLILVPATLGWLWWFSVHRVRLLRAEQATRAPAPVSTITTLPVPVHAPALPSRPRAPGQGWGLVLLAFGGLLASWGGLVSLGLLVGLLTQPKPENLPAVLIGGAMIGFAPLVAGVLMFVRGIKRLNQRAPAPVVAGS